MKLQLEKSMRILNNLMTYCHTLGAREYDIHLAHEGAVSRLELTAPIAQVDAAALEELREALSLPRQHEVEQNYWELSGESECDCELTLIGMMLDEALVEHRDGALHIRATRRE